MSRTNQLTLVTACRWILLAIGLVLLLAFGVDVLFQTELVRGGMRGVMDWVPLAEMGEAPLVALGALALLLPLLYAAVALMEHRLERGIVGKGNDGESICLKPEAIERTVRREVRHQVEEVLRVLSCQVRQGGKAPHVAVRISVSDHAPVPQVRKKVQDVVADTLERLIGFSKGSKIVVQVREIADPSSAKGRRLRHEPAGRHAPKPHEGTAAPAAAKDSSSTP